MSLVMDYLKKKGVSELYSHQREAVIKALGSRKNIIISFATGGGKTLVAEILILEEIVKRNKKVVYVVPLKALANDMLRNFSVMLEYGIKVSVMTGDNPVDDDELMNSDLVITTIEKFDSVLRRNRIWVDDVGLVVIDEFHMIGSPLRGGRIENIVRKAREQRWRIISLSATVPNIEELADWMDADYFISDDRPVRQYWGVHYRGLRWVGKAPEDLWKVGDKWESIVREAYKKGLQVLIFVPRRRDTKSVLRKLREFFLKCGYSPRIEAYHGGLSYGVRRKIERDFKDRQIDIVVSTNALAMGVNFPVDVVIVKGLLSITDFGMERLDREMFYQMIGRAGRPGFSSVGYAFVIATSKEKYDWIMKMYFSRKSDRVLTSYFVTSKVLRHEILGWLYEKASLSFDEIVDLVKRSFWYHQNRDDDLVFGRVLKIMEFLVGRGFVHFNESSADFSLTDLGEVTAESYLDPLTAMIYIDLLVRQKRFWKVSDVYEILCQASELDLPKLSGVRDLDFVDEMSREIIWHSKVPSDEVLPRTVVMLSMMEFYNGVSVYVLSEKYGIGSSDIYGWNDTFKWHIYFLGRVLKEGFVDVRGLGEVLDVVRIQQTNRVDEDLARIMSWGVGKKVAEKLYKNGILSYDDLSYERLRDLGLRRDTIEKLLSAKVNVISLDNFWRDADGK